MKQKGYLLDTNICIHLFKGRYGLREKLLQAGLDNCYISEITLAELTYGAACSANVQKHTTEIEQLLRIVTVLPISPAIKTFAKVKAELRKKGMMIDNFDLLIGVTALENGLTMVTENVKHLCHIPGLSIENWIQR